MTEIFENVIIKMKSPLTGEGPSLLAMNLHGPTQVPTFMQRDLNISGELPMFAYNAV